jgi:alkanesulfonate monooxygenase SsuD/methylene tetrahydromethanopterin reductase-like flavin-dependent oxidoreductase (luciferase family)
MQSKRQIDVSCQLITCISNDAEMAVERAKKTIAFYISVGQIYREFLAKNGFQRETKNIFDEYTKSGFKSNYELVPESMIEQLCIYGTPDEGIKKIKKFKQVGVDLPIIQFNPIGDVRESFNLLTKTFSQIENE